ncbi:MAG: GntR family transcriptional regulator, partial [Enterococcus sp.]
MVVPLYKQIRDDIRKKIEADEYKESERIPTEFELADQYGVSRPTIRQAVQALVDEGYLEKRKKRGTIVIKPKIQQEFTHVIESFDSEMHRKGMAPKTKVIYFKQTKASEEVAENLGLVVGEAVYKLTRLRYAAEKPIVLVTSYIPSHLFPDFEEIDFEKKKMYQV